MSFSKALQVNQRGWLNPARRPSFYCRPIFSGIDDESVKKVQNPSRNCCKFWTLVVIFSKESFHSAQLPTLDADKKQLSYKWNDYCMLQCWNECMRTQQTTSIERHKFAAARALRLAGMRLYGNEFLKLWSKFRAFCGPENESPPFDYVATNTTINWNFEWQHRAFWIISGLQRK